MAPSAPIKSPWEIRNRATPGTIDANDLILYAPEPGTPFVTVCLSTTPAGIVTAGAGGVVASGTYIPVADTFVNVDTVVPDLARWHRIAAIVFVSGLVNINPTAALAASFSLSLPIASTFVANDVSGTFSNNVLDNGRITVGAAKASFQFTAVGTTDTLFGYQFAYTILP